MTWSARPMINMRKKGVNHKKALSSSRFLGVFQFLTLSQCFVIGFSPLLVPSKPKISSLLLNVKVFFSVR